MQIMLQVPIDRASLLLPIALLGAYCQSLDTRIKARGSSGGNAPIQVTA